MTKTTTKDDAPPTTQYLETLKMALYAKQGGRKTLQIGHLIDEFGVENVGIISAEHGLNTIGSKLDRRFVQEVKGLDDLRRAWKWASETFKHPDQWTCVDGGSRVIAWIRDDLVSGIGAAYEEVMSGTRVQDLPAHLRKYAIYITKTGEVNMQGMWAKAAMESERLLSGWVSLPSSSYWTFWEEQSQIDQYTKGLPWTLDVPGNGPRTAVKGAFDFIGRLTRTDDGGLNACFNDISRLNYAKRRDDWDSGFRVADDIKDFNLAHLARALRGQPAATATMVA